MSSHENQAFHVPTDDVAIAFGREGRELRTVGLIGCGRIGYALADGLLGAHVLAPQQLLLSQRSSDRTAALSRRYTHLRIADANRDVAQQSDCLLLCVRPHELLPVLSELGSDLRADVHLVSTVAGLSLDVLFRATAHKVSRLMPSVTVRAHTAVSLVCHHASVGADDAAFLRTILEPISEVMMIREDDFPEVTNVTSSAPAFIAAACQEVAKMAVRSSGVSLAEAEQMVRITLYGAAKLLHEHGSAYDALIDEVATRGGITEEGIRVLRVELPLLLEKVFDVTETKTERLAPAFGTNDVL